MNKRQAKRLLNVARASREHPVPERFSMNCYIHGDEFSTRQNQDAVKRGGVTPKDWCGTPACALGTFASRTDLQRKFVILRGSGGLPQLSFREGEAKATYDSHASQDYFGLSYGQMSDIFGYDGCGGAKSPEAAALYIEAFVKKHQD